MSRTQNPFEGMAVRAGPQNGFLLGGAVSDRVGRKPMVVLANVLAAAGTILIFTGRQGLFVPGFFLDAAAGACFVTVTLAYVAELFPTELRATLSSVVISCQVAAGSLGLALLGAVSGLISISLAMVILGGSLLVSLLLLRGLPETRGRDLIHSGPPAVDVVPPIDDALPREPLVPA